MPDTVTLKVAEDFSPTPFGRYREDGEESGQVFREDVLHPALNKYHHVVLDIDGCVGLPSSFWEESLGGLVRDGISAADLRSRLDVVATRSDMQTFIRLAWKYVDEAQKKLSRKR